MEEFSCDGLYLHEKELDKAGLFLIVRVVVDPARMDVFKQVIADNAEQSVSAEPCCFCFDVYHECANQFVFFEAYGD